MMHPRFFFSSIQYYGKKKERKNQNYLNVKTASKYLTVENFLIFISKAYQ